MHQDLSNSSLSPAIVLSRQEAWQLPGNPRLYTRISGISFYAKTNASTGQCLGSGRRLDLSQNAFVDTGIALNGDAGALQAITLNASAFVAAANAIGYSLPTNGQGCIKLDIDYQAGSSEKVPLKLSTSIAPRNFEYGAIQNAGSNQITSGTAVNNQAMLLRSAALTLNRSAFAQCWGRNTLGQLGDGTHNSSNTPVSVANTLGHGVVKIVTGRNHSCALLKTGAVKCWGQNQYGQLGTGNTVDQLLPTPVQGLNKNVIDIASGRESVCALLRGGSVKCWGQNSFFQLGDNSKINRSTPTDVSGLSAGVKRIAAGYIHACVLLKNGKIKCWGEGSYGQLGIGDIESKSIPTEVANIGGNNPEATAIAAGPYSTCAIVNKGGFFANGAVECWGGNAYGQLGDGSVTTRLLPTPVIGISKGASAISIGLGHSCAIVSGALKCWGSNRQGQLGISNRPELFTTPQTVPGFSKVTYAVSANNTHTCAAESQPFGSIKCWGGNSDGQIGNAGVSLNTNISSPVLVSNQAFGATDSISDGNNSAFSCMASNAARIDKPLLSASANTISLNNIGDQASGITVNDLSARGISSDCGNQLNGSSQCNFSYDGRNSRGDGAIAISDSSGLSHVFPFHIQRYGHAVCWGSNNFSQLGIADSGNRNQATPIVLAAQTLIKQVVTGSHHACALTQNGRVACWGDNSYGQLGNDSVAQSNTPLFVSAFDQHANVLRIAAGADHTCALLTDGSVECWGKNDLGQLGIGSHSNQAQPTMVHSLTAAATAITTGSNSSCALLKSGQAMCWGQNNRGQLGDSTHTNRTTPVAVSNLTDSLHKVVAISSGKESSCALLSDGSVKCWGKNTFAQLGIGSTSFSSATPQHVPSLGAGVASISVGGAGACALMQDSSVKCWGSNSVGQVGVGSDATVISTPQTVSDIGNQAVALSTGQAHNCALLNDGSVKCWGRNIDGQLGNGSFTGSNTPVTVSELANVNELDTSSGDSSFSCAIH